MSIHSCFFFSSRRRHTRWPRDWSSDVCSSDLQSGRIYGLREVRVLGEEAVARVNRVGAGLLRRTDVLLREQVARDLYRLVGRTRVERTLVVRRDDRDRGDPQISCGAKDTQRDLTAVRDEQFLNQAFFPGFSRFCGSNARFTAPCSSNARGPSCFASQFRFTKPTPCSPEIVPPSRSASSKSSSDSRGASATSSCLSPASKNDVCRLPSPA